MLQAKVPVVKDLVLLGGGHSHVEVLRSFGMRPMPGVRLTLVTRDVHTPYSGMLPGYVSGFYTYDDCHIDLVRLSGWAKARLIHAEATGLDTTKRRITFRDRPPLLYDVLSIDIGITPDSQTVPGAREHTVPVKPIDRFVGHMDELLSRHAESSTPLKVVVVGGGAGGVEVALSLQHRLEAERKAAGKPDSMTTRVGIVCRGKLLDSHTSYARSSLLKIIADKGVTVHEQCEVLRVEAGKLIVRHQLSGAGGSTATASTEVITGLSAAGQEDCVEFDECLWCTQASAASWLKQTGLPTDAAGFLRISETLQSEGGPAEVFACGDVASSTKHPRPKAGVFAVRQGPPLTANLRRFLSGEPLEPFVPQRTFLSLITTGDRYCVGTKGWMGLQGGYLWHAKDYIDRSFMRKYSDDLPDMMSMMRSAGTDMQAGKGGAAGQAAQPPPAVSAAGPEALSLLAESKMRCGGCGAKVGASVLSRVLARLPTQPSAVGQSEVVVSGLDTPDDAALIRPPPPGKLLVQTVDFFKSFWDDPYLFGQIAANHALGDVWAMGARPTTALAIAVVPLMSDVAVEEELTAMMTGAHKVLSAAGCALVGGHTCEGPDLSLGFSVTGEVDEARVLRKGGLQPGQVLVLTKPLGCGALMAGYMRGKAKGRHVMSALNSMVQSSQAASEVLLAHGATAATDVTGFGLAGHLVEMLRPSRVAAELDWSSIPFLPGAREVLEQGITSSIHGQNVKASASINSFDQVMSSQPTLWPILMDPQTGGGLLAGLPADQADACVQALHAAGYSQACIIGRIQHALPGQPPLTMRL